MKPIQILNKLQEDENKKSDWIVDFDIPDTKVNLVDMNMCPYCTKKLNNVDKEYIKEYGMCQKCFENGVE